MSLEHPFPDLDQYPEDFQQAMTVYDQMTDQEVEALVLKKISTIYAPKLAACLSIMSQPMKKSMPYGTHNTLSAHAIKSSAIACVVLGWRWLHRKNYNF
ncbi:hypothetical protein [Lacticaseibacillus manihotivorans]|uniref:hypothetical protein n=1 Tax=Lacticaseibacillus manihotivorans TaxID=88233 RepID=UPI0006D15CFB|nr:hypothetical protein [Lacticaseibacillus manihotivorans]